MEGALLLSDDDIPKDLDKATSHTLKLGDAPELQRLKDKNKNRNTERSTNTWVKKFEEWLAEKGKTLSLVEVRSVELDIFIQHFYAQVKKDESNYEPESLRTMIAALDRHARELGCKFSILKYRKFTESGKVLNGKAIELKKKGLGKMKNKAFPVGEDEVQMLWDSGVLGDDNPVSLNYAMFFTLSQHFWTRGRQEYHQLRVEDLKFLKNATTGETELVEWVEELTKTQQGGLVKQNRRVPQKAYKTGEKSCWTPENERTTLPDTS